MSSVRTNKRNLIKELLGASELLLALVQRQVSARYRGSFLGFIWSFLNPIFLVGVYTLVFKLFIRFEAQSDYALFMLSGMLPWLWFSTGSLEASTSISGAGALVSKAMFPVQVLPVATVLSHGVHYLFALPVLLIFSIVSGKLFLGSLVFLPIVIGIHLLLSSSVSILLASLNVRFRDVQHLVGNLFSFLFFLSPIVYPTTSVPLEYRQLYFLNPLASIIQYHHYAFAGGEAPPMWSLAYSLLASLLLFVLSAKVFYSFRDEFAELV